MVKFFTIRRFIINKFILFNLQFIIRMRESNAYRNKISKVKSTSFNRDLIFFKNIIRRYFNYLILIEKKNSLKKKRLISKNETSV